MRISVLNDNIVYKRGLVAEHGLSIRIETNEKTIVFDVGQSGVFFQNGIVMKCSMANVDAIVLSHGHYDHCGGMNYLLRQDVKCPPVYVRKEAFTEKVSANKDKTLYRNTGIAWNPEDIKELHQIEKPLTEIFQNVFLLGNIPMNNSFEKREASFFVLKDGKYLADDMRDEQMLIIRENGGLFVFSGCSHCGIINSLNHVKRVFKEEPIYMVMAGMHLLRADKERIEKTVEALKEINPGIVIPLHCTGLEAISYIKQSLGGRCQLAETGAVFNL
ncbi:MAG: MBL fold metallo-hydrolase [Lachnospiraceae bacterium]|nr:MBL fold metallo-hydrolase [Lachnospiraceae bacterium]